VAQQAKITIRVTAARTTSTVAISTTGRYARLTTGGISITAPGQAMQPTADAKTFWLSVLDLVEAQLTALEG
jgi:hypothetical protein